MDRKTAAELRQKALDAYNYDETYALTPAEVTSMAVTMRRFTIFQQRFESLLEERSGGRPITPQDFYIASAMLTAAAAITHLEEIIRVPEQPAPTAPVEQKEDPDGIA